MADEAQNSGDDPVVVVAHKHFHVEGEDRPDLHNQLKDDGGETDCTEDGAKDSGDLAACVAADSQAVDMLANTQASFTKN